MSDRTHIFGAMAVLSLSMSGCAPMATAQSAAAKPVPQTSEWLAECENWDDWDKPGPPYRIHGITYYVGTCGISAILITGDKGHILIDTGTNKGANVVAANIKRLGFDPKDVAILLSSHEHHDHIGGLAKMQKFTNAQVIASIAAATVIGSGRASARDPQFGMHDPMEPVGISSLIQDGELVRLGNLELTAIATPGHTPGALSWRWESCDADGCISVVYADSLSPVSSDSYKFGDHPEYVAAYRQGLGRLASLDCNLLITPHPSASGMVERLAGAAPWIDADGCKNYARSISDRLDKRLDEEIE